MKRFLAPLGALLASACTVGPNYVRPQTPVPPAYSEPQIAGGMVDPARWWTAFGDPELTTLVERALKDNPDIQIAASRVREARLNEIVAGSYGKPTLNANGGVSNIEFSKNAGFASIAQALGGGGGTSGGGASAGGGASSSSGLALPGSGITTYSVGLDASWELDLLGADRRAVEGAVARTEAAEWNARDAAVMIAAEVAQTYFALRLDQTQTQVIADELARERRALQIAGNQAKVGLVPQVDVTRQRSSITSNEARLPPIRADIDVRIHALGILLGQPPAALTSEFALDKATPAGPVPVVPAGLPADLLRRRPDVRAAERNLAAATADIGVAVADLYPKISLTGMEQLLSTALGNLFTRDSLQLQGSGMFQFPLIDWGRRKATVGIRKETRQQTYIQYQETVLSALRDVEDPLAQIAAERQRNLALHQAVADAQVSATSAEAQYRTGFVAQDTLLNAQTQVLQAREQLASSDTQLRTLTAGLFKAIGGGWEDAGQPVRH